MSQQSAEFDSDVDIDWELYILNDRYIPIRRLGYGSYSSVWLCYDAEYKKLVAVKIHNINDEIAGIKEERMLHIIKKLESPYLMEIMDSFSVPSPYRDGSHRCIVMNIMLGSMYDVITEDKYLNGIPANIVINVIYQMLIGLKEVHKLGYIHTDIKPENILVAGLSIKDTDFLTYINLNENTNIDDINEVKKIVHKYYYGLNEYDNDDDHDCYSDDNSDCNIDDTTNMSNISDISDLSDIPDNLEMDCDTNSEFSDRQSYDIEASYRIDRSEVSENDNFEDETIQDNINDTGMYRDIINECNIKLSDLGTCIKYKKKMSKFDIQTRYYKSPEILLHLNYNQNCDIWALGCTMYELLTGNILFNPDGVNGISRERYHLHDIERKLGSIPMHMKKESKLNDIYYTSNGKIKGIREFVPEPLFLTLGQHLLENDTEKHVIDNVIDFIHSCLEIEPCKRYNVDDCLSHPIFKLI